jgi:hypothetical protein
MNLIENIHIDKPYNQMSTDKSAASTFIDMAGWDAALFILTVSTEYNSSGYVDIQQSSGLTTDAAWRSTNVLFMSPTSGQMDLYVVDVVKPQKRYLRLVYGDSSMIPRNVQCIKYCGTLLGTTEVKADLISSTLYICSSST